MLATVLYGASLVIAVYSQQNISQNALQLDRNCYPAYVISPSPCTCRKTSQQVEGLVQWIFSNGTVANQTSNPQNGTSTLIVQSPYKYALNESYICRTVVDQGKKGEQLPYTARFLFGPESATLRWAEEPKEPIYICPSNETKELKMRCEVPSTSINPRPVYTAFVDGVRFGGYDRLGGRLVEADKVWRLDINFKLTTAGNHTVFCHVRNMYFGANWFTLQQDIVVSDKPPASYRC
jgi:hypothetical protein